MIYYIHRLNNEKSIVIHFYKIDNQKGGNVGYKYKYLKYKSKYIKYNQNILIN